MIEFKLPDMTCGHCASIVTRALRQVDPACQVSIDLQAKTVRVTSLEAPELLAEGLAEAGYSPA